MVRRAVPRSVCAGGRDCGRRNPHPLRVAKRPLVVGGASRVRAPWDPTARRAESTLNKVVSMAVGAHAKESRLGPDSTGCHGFCSGGGKRASWAIQLAGSKYRLISPNLPPP